MPAPNSEQATASPETPAEPEAPTETEDAPNLSQPDPEPTGEETPPPEPEPDEEEETAEAEPPETEDTELDPRLQAKIDRRIGKEVARRKKAEAELAALKAQAGPATPEPAVPDPLETQEGQGPAPFSARSKEIEMSIAEARQHIAWCEANPDGGEVEGAEGKVHSFSADQVRLIKAGAMETLIDRKADLKEWNREMGHQHQHYDKLAVEQYPWLADKKSPQFVAASTVLRAYPEFKNFPGWKLALGDMIAGREARQGRVPKRGTPAAVPKPTRLPGQPATSAPKTAPAPVAAQSKAQVRFEKEGSVDALAASFAAKRQNQNAFS